MSSQILGEAVVSPLSLPGREQTPRHRSSARCRCSAVKAAVHGRGVEIGFALGHLAPGTPTCLPVLLHQRPCGRRSDRRTPPMVASARAEMANMSFLMKVLRGCENCVWRDANEKAAPKKPELSFTVA